MKTLTEFPIFSLKNASKVRQDLVAGGKTPEELPAALGEQLKLEGDKLQWMSHCLEIVGEKMDQLKRVVVMSLAEGEKPPTGAIQKGEHYFLVEFYAPPAPKGGQDTGRGGPGGKGRDGRRGGGRGGPGGKDRGGRGNREGGGKPGGQPPSAPR